MFHPKAASFDVKLCVSISQNDNRNRRSTIYFFVKKGVLALEALGASKLDLQRRTLLIQWQARRDWLIFDDIEGLRDGQFVDTSGNRYGCIRSALTCVAGK